MTTKNSLQYRLFLALTLILLIPALSIVSFLFTWSIYKISIQRTSENVIINLETTAMYMDGTFERYESVSNLLVQNSQVKDMIFSDQKYQDKSSYIRKLTSTLRPIFSDIAVSIQILDHEGNLYAEHNDVQLINLYDFFQILKRHNLNSMKMNCRWYKNDALNNILGLPTENLTYVQQINGVTNNGVKNAFIIISFPKGKFEKMLLNNVSSYQSLLLFTTEDNLALSINNLNLSLEDVYNLSEKCAFSDFGSGHKSYEYNNIDYSVDFTTIPTSNWILVLISDANYFSQTYRDYYIIYGISITIFTAIVLFILKRLTSHYLSPLSKLSSSMEKVINGNLDSRLPESEGKGEIQYLTSRYNLMLDSIQKLLYTIYDEQEKKKQVEITLLQNQINPHFLNNVLGAVRYLNMSHRTQEVEKIVLSLNILLRKLLSKKNELITLAEELELLNHYIDIQKVLLDGTLECDYTIDPKIYDALIPKFILQPIVENSFMHGFKLKKSVAKLRISATLDHKYLCIKIIDNGVGTSRQKQIIENLNNSDVNSRHIGLCNVNRRLRLIYDDQYNLTFWSKLNLGTIVIIKVPLKK